MSMTVLRKSLTKRQIQVLAAVAVFFIAYYGVPIPFLSAPVRDHLQSRYGVMVDIGSVRLSLRGIVVGHVTGVSPVHNATFEVKELIIGLSPLKSIARHRPVFERIRMVNPIITLRLPEKDFLALAPVRVPDDAGGQPAPADTEPRSPATIDLKVRGGQIHLMRGERSIDIHQFDAEVTRDAPGEAVAWAKIESGQLGNIELTYVQGRRLEFDARGISLDALTDVAGTPQKLGGFLNVHVDKTRDSVSGTVRVDDLSWTGPVASPVAMHAEPAVSTDTLGVDLPPDTSASDTSAPSAEPSADTASVFVLPVDSVPAPAAHIQFIRPSFTAEVAWKGRWVRPKFFLDEAMVDAEGIRGRVSGEIEFSRRLDAVLDLYVPDFDETSLCGVGEHFHVLRYLVAFLKTIETPSRLQAKMQMHGPLTRPAQWRYDGLIDIRRDTFSYGPFLGQYAFLGTVEFNERGVNVPEVLMPFGDASLVLSGSAADYASGTTDLTLKGAGLEIGSVLQFYLPRAILPGDTMAEPPSGAADVDLRLTRNRDEWSLDGEVSFKRVKIPLAASSSAARAYGKFRLSGQRGDGEIRMRLGTFETVLNPYALALFQDSAELGLYLKQSNIRWDILAANFVDASSAPFLPIAGSGDVSLRIHSEREELADESSPVDSAPRVDDPASVRRKYQTRWWTDGTVELRNARLRLPPFATSLENASAFLTFDRGEMRLDRASGMLAGSSVRGEGISGAPGSRTWTLNFSSPDLDLAALLESIRPGPEPAEPQPFEVKAEVSTGRLRFHGFDIPGPRGRFVISPGRFSLDVDTPIRSRYRLTRRGGQSSSDLMFATPDSYPLKRLFGPHSAISGDISGTVALRAPTFADSRAISGYMDLQFDRLSFMRAPALLQLVDVMRLSLTDAIVFEPFSFHSKIENGIVRLDMDNPSNAGRWAIRGRLGLDAVFFPLTESDSAFRVTFYPRENIVTKILYETKILNLLGGKREGIKLDFGLIGNYNKSNILWTEEPLVSVILGRVSELVPGFIGTPTHPDTAPFTLRQKPRTTATDSP